MPAGKELERLLARVVSVYTEGEQEEGAIAEEVQTFAGPGLDEEGEELVATVLRALRQISAAAERRATLPPAPPSALRGALGGADLVMRSEILSGRAAEIPNMLPGFVYLATVPFLDYAEALRGSERVREILEGEGYSPR